MDDQGSRRTKVVVMPDSPEIQLEELNDRSYESDYFNVEDRSVMKILDQLGGHKGKKVCFLSRLPPPPPQFL